MRSHVCVCVCVRVREREKERERESEEAVKGENGMYERKSIRGGVEKDK